MFLWIISQLTVSQWRVPLSGADSSSSSEVASGHQLKKFLLLCVCMQMNMKCNDGARVGWMVLSLKDRQLGWYFQTSWLCWGPTFEFITVAPPPVQLSPLASVLCQSVFHPSDSHSTWNRKYVKQAKGTYNLHTRSGNILTMNFWRTKLIQLLRDRESSSSCNCKLFHVHYVVADQRPLLRCLEIAGVDLWLET